MSHSVVIDWGPGALSCSCGWEPTYDFATYDGSDWQEHDYGQHLLATLHESVPRTKKRRIVDAAVAYVVWHNKVPTPPDYLDELNHREDELASAVMDYLGNDRWWDETYAPDGWPEEAKP